MMKRNKRWLAFPFLALFASACYLGAANRPPRPIEADGASLASASPSDQSARFVSLNVVRGTRMPIPNFLVRESTQRANLEVIGQLLHAQDPTVVALQESIHGPVGSQTALIARHGGFSHFADDASISSGSLRHSASLVSSVPWKDLRSETLVRGTTREKGWVAATVAVEPFGGREVRVVSVHLDPLSPDARARQVEQLTSELETEPLPLVVMGDFNCEWSEERCVQRFATRLGLQAAPSEGVATYAFWGVRRHLDWILVSDPLEIRSVRVLPARVSDHRPVVAEVGWVDRP